MVTVSTLDYLMLVAIRRVNRDYLTIMEFADYLSMVFVGTTLNVYAVLTVIITSVKNITMPIPHQANPQEVLRIYHLINLRICHRINLRTPRVIPVVVLRLLANSSDRVTARV